MAERIVENLKAVRERIADAAHRAGRPPGDVALVAVTKQRPLSDIYALQDGGQTVFAENRVHEFLDKMDRFDAARPKPEWHFIGHVQTRKAKDLVGAAALLHGVDSLKLAEKLERAAEAQDATVDILLEVNVSGEEAKFGLAPGELENAAEALAPLERVRCRGLMTMAPFVDDPEATRSVFAGLRKCLERLRARGFDHVDASILSMGMTNDFEVAVEEGATHVRVGTALFQ